MVSIIQDLIPKGSKNRPGKNNPMKYITIHNTGNGEKGADAKAHASYVKGQDAANIPASWHYTVDDKQIYQHIPDYETAWHCGDGENGIGNNQSIGIEICMNSDGDLLMATNNAAGLAASLIRAHNIPVENVVQHNRWSGKNCPQMIREGKPYNWETFIEKIKAGLKREEGGMKIYESIDELSGEWRDAVQWALDQGIVKGNGKTLGLSESDVKSVVFLYRYDEIANAK